MGVSKQAVHTKIKKEPLKSALCDKMETIDNALHINVDGERLIKSAFNVKMVDESANEVIEVLKAQIMVLNVQNEELRKENSKLTERVLEQTDKILQLAEQGQKLAKKLQTLHTTGNVNPQGTRGKKRGFFSRFFSMFKFLLT